MTALLDKPKVGWWLCGVLAMLLHTVSGVAQSITLETYAPGELGQDDFQIRRPVDQGHHHIGLQLHGSYANDPLVMSLNFDDGRASQTSKVVQHLTTTTLNLSWGLADRLVLYGSLPLVAHMAGTSNAAIQEEADDPGLANLQLGARVRLFGTAEDPVALAFQAGVSAPTSGKYQLLRSVYRWAVHPSLLFELRPGRLRITTNLGARIHRKDGTTNINQLSALTYGVGLGLTVVQTQRSPSTRLDLIAQAYGSTEFSNFLKEFQSPLDLLGGFKFVHHSGFHTGIAGGPGLSSAPGTPTYRVVGTLGWEMPPEPRIHDADGDGLPDDQDECIGLPEDKDNFEDHDGCPDPDDDHDGVADEADQCRDTPEDADGFEDGDGCPDPDNDRDGLLDEADNCPDEAEDTDDFEDIDGCPDPDNDADMVMDAEDECPNEAGTLERKGCPNPDRDGDGVLDAQDNCPDEAGDPANHGCKKRQQVSIAADRLEIHDVVHFRSGKALINRRSYPLLFNIAQVINAHPEIPAILIEGHSDNRGRRAVNVRLSQGRAEAVKRFLIRKGQVDPSRLGAIGYGPDRPIIPNARSRAEHAQNRRVEFSFTDANTPPAPVP